MNNREIKFRVWHRIQKKYYDNNINDWPFLLTPVGHVCEWDGGCWTNGDYNDYRDKDDEYQKITYVIQQYTGVKDKNSKEIYEGDIIEYTIHNYPDELTRIGFVSFMAGMFLVNWSDQTDQELGYMSISSIKVIGNIFENPELLK
jgi:uncharacterized phage protein (TIGR01671 family)